MEPNLKYGLIAQDFLVCRREMLQAMVNSERYRRKSWEKLKKLRPLLSSNEYKVLKLRFVNRMTLDETGKEMGVTRERIRQIEEKADEKLRQADPLKGSAIQPIY